MVTDNASLLRNACVVAAHPDDEILWFSSILKRISHVYICFLGNARCPKLGRGRQSALAQIPLDGVVSLGIEEADVYDLARWPDPEPTQYGLALAKTHGRDVCRDYRANFAQLAEELAKRLAGFDTVFTHNPWGEYGHEEHVQVYRAVRQAQAHLGFDLWCSAYVGPRSHALMVRCLDSAAIESITLETDVPLALDIAARYKEHKVWTWFDAYQWPASESFLLITPGHHGTPIAAPLSYLNMDRPAVALADQSLRNLARKVRRLWSPRPASDSNNTL